MFLSTHQLNFIVIALNNPSSLFLSFFARKHHVAGVKRWWILQKIPRKLYKLCLCIFNSKEMCNAYFAAGFGLFYLPSPQPL